MCRIGQSPWLGNRTVTSAPLVVVGVSEQWRLPQDQSDQVLLRNPTLLCLSQSLRSTTNGRDPGSIYTSIFSKVCLLNQLFPKHPALNTSAGFGGAETTGSFA